MRWGINGDVADRGIDGDVADGGIDGDVAVQRLYRLFIYGKAQCTRRAVIDLCF